MKTAFIVIGIFVVVFGVLAKVYEYLDMEKLKAQIKADAERNKRPASNFSFEDREYK